MSSRGRRARVSSGEGRARSLPKETSQRRAARERVLGSSLERTRRRAGQIWNSMKAAGKKGLRT